MHTDRPRRLALFIPRYILVMLTSLSLDSELHLGERSRHSLLLVGLLGSFRLGQCSSHGSRLLHAQILRHILGTGAGLAKALLLLLVVHRQNASDRLAD